MQKLGWIIGVCALFFSSVAVQAQMLEEQNFVGDSYESNEALNTELEAALSGNFGKKLPERNEKKFQPAEKVDYSTEISVKGVAPKDLPNVPTYDGSKRGNVAISRLRNPDEKQDEDEDEKLIFVYYKDFNIRHTASGRTQCDVKFVVLSNLDEKLSNLSMKLRWPRLSTSVIFLDVSPNIQVYHSYTLMGDGCYSMDKIPNIIVNRCRIKGYSQKECAQKIRWLKIS